ncbi:MAG: molybdopterin-guanine dinucleotide biosynthesis protein B [Tissierellia bacterium]|nr:molybdopterin-guanine dinucleotide biosynthesis protein B [Tissierellia bacterium]
MKVFGVSGTSNSGKTTIVEEIIIELGNRGYSVGSVKSIGCGKDDDYHDSTDSFSIDRFGTDSYIHKEAGSKLVTTWAENETALIYPRRLEIEDIILNYNHDFLIIEGFKKSGLPKVITGQSREDVNLLMSDSVFAISGKISDEESEINGIKVYKTFEEVNELVDLIVENVPEYKYLDTNINLKVFNKEVDTESVERELYGLLKKLGIHNQDVKISISEK